jgi:uncharacterized protein (TIGR02996 family)
MSEEETALIAGIAANPDDDLPRLVYADWLQEHDRDIYAEFIRLQCEIAKLEVGPRAVIDQNVHLWRRQQELLDGHLPELITQYDWIQDTGFLDELAIFRRGFLDELSLSAKHYFANLDWLEKLMVLPNRFRVGVSPKELPQFLTGYQQLHALVTEFSVEEYEAEPGLAFPQAIDWPRLKSFVVVNSPFPNMDWLTFVVGHMPKLEELSLPYNQLNDLDIIHWLESGIFGQLKSITLFHNHIGDQAALELADRFPKVNRLQSLDLRHNAITSVGQNALLSRFGSKVTLF